MRISRRDFVKSTTASGIALSITPLAIAEEPNFDARQTLPGRPAMLYKIVTETGMPNLEENLRYAVGSEQRCLTRPDLSSAFPILNHPSLADCRLRYEREQDDTLSYILVCDGVHGTTGSATWRIAEQVMRGTLNVKLGGKNMTLFQRVTASVVGQCPAAQ